MTGRKHIIICSLFIVNKYTLRKCKIIYIHVDKRTLMFLSSFILGNETDSKTEEKILYFLPVSFLCFNDTRVTLLKCGFESLGLIIFVL